MSTPRRAAAASADTIDTGVAITSAHGHAITSSTSAAVHPLGQRLAAARRAAPSITSSAKRDDDRRVDAGEAIDEGLRRRALRLRLLDQVDDPRDRRVAPGPRHADVEAPVPLMRPGEHLVAGVFDTGDRLAGDGRLVDLGLAARHLAVERDLLARAAPAPCRRP